MLMNLEDLKEQSAQYGAGFNLKIVLVLASLTLLSS
jgi:hypothetical protein